MCLVQVIEDNLKGLLAVSDIAEFLNFTVQMLIRKNKVRQIKYFCLFL